MATLTLILTSFLAHSRAPKPSIHETQTSGTSSGNKVPVITLKSQNGRKGPPKPAVTKETFRLCLCWGGHGGSCVFKSGSGLVPFLSKFFVYAPCDQKFASAGHVAGVRDVVCGYTADPVPESNSHVYLFPT